ncbi:MAG: hypothetical protein RLZZ401_1932 [Pseudomonadota bacterium]|jgi:hypothetical protein
MSTLQISLAVTGGVVLAAIVAHSAWSARKNTPRQPEGPALSSEALREPMLDPLMDAGAATLDSDALVLPKALPLPVADKRLGLDALVDAIAPIRLEHALYGQAALNAMPPTRRAGSKPFAIEGLNADTQVWETPHASQRYSAFQAGVQLANRTGPLNEIEFSEFVVKTQGFADAINGTPEFPEMLDAVAHARELDQFAGTHDAHLGFCLRAVGAAWSPGYIQQHAARLGLVPGAIPGRMVLPSATPGLPPILSLVFDTQAALAEDLTQSAVHELDLKLEVPHVDRSERPFQRLREVALSLASSMDGRVTDDHGQALSSGTMDQIGADLEQRYDQLDSREFSAGSPLARRLFS